MVVDYRNVNSKTITDKYPMPNIEELLDKLHNCKYFTTIDLTSGFHQIEMDPKSIAKTAFNAGTEGHFEHLRMPFGLRNAPATFQRCMNNILQAIPNCVVYLDDILIYNASKESHFRTLELVLERLSKYNMKIQLDKSEFFKTETAYLGHVISNEGVRPSPEKIKCIEKFPIPKTVTQIKSFLGLVGYYRKYIKDFAKIAKPLHACLKKDATINIKDLAYNEAFHSLKSALMNEPILTYPDFTKTFTLTTDASNFALGAVLSQNDHPIAYASRTLNDHEKNYSTIEKELLAIVWATKHFRPYLFGQKFKIITDHRPLTWLFNLKEPNSKLVCWRLKLEEYDYEIEYKPGKQNSNADALSRIEIHNNEAEEAMDYISLDTNQQERMSVETQDGTVHSNQENPIIGIEINSKSPLNIFKNQIIVRTSNSTKNVKITKLFDKKGLTLNITPEKYEVEINTFIKEFLKPKRKYAIYFEDKTDGTYTKFSRCLQRNFKTSNLKITKTIVTDNGTEFTNNIIKEFLKSFGVELHITAIEHPQSNGMVERFHSTLREHYRLITTPSERITLSH
ncbi:hypothetical protein M8J77_022863 [Diaphorina citri]|nr:hypothetical protein M8J77_022863 [Diaphorina citri]